MKNIRWVVLLFVIAMCVSYVVGQTNIPKLDQRVNDFTNTLSFQEWQTLDRLLKSYEDTTSTQIVVLMINSLEGRNIEEYANKTFEANQIGQLKNDKGVLLVIAKQEQAVRIEVGYGLEGSLTDAVSSQIIRNEIAPYLKSDNYFGGIATCVDAIARTTTGEYHVDDQAKEALFLVIIIAVIIIVVVTIVIPFLLTLQKAMSRCSSESRTINPRSVWLLLVPVFNIVWQFIVVLRVSTSLGNEFVRRNIVKEPNPGRKIGLAWCILSSGSILYYIINFICKVMLTSHGIMGIIGIVISIAGFICFIVYWRKITSCSAEIALPHKGD